MTTRQAALLDWIRREHVEHLTTHEIQEACGLYGSVFPVLARQDKCAGDLMALKRQGLVSRGAGAPARWHLTVEASRV